MEKLALNRYERYLYSQPEDRKFDDPRLQRAHNKIQQAKSIKTTASIRKKMNPNGQLGTKILEAKADQFIRANRQGSHPQMKPDFDTAKKTKKNPTGTNDSLARDGRYTNIRKQLDEIELQKAISNKPENKFFARAKRYIGKHPVKSGLMGLGAVATAGLVTYGIKKDIEGN